MKNLTTQTWATVRAQRRILMLSAAATLSWLCTGGAAAQPAQSAAEKSKATAASVRDLEPFLMAPYPPSTPFLQPIDYVIGYTFPQPPAVARRDMLTSTALPENFVGVLTLRKRLRESTLQDLILTFDLGPVVTLPRGTPRPGFPALRIERIQPGLVANVTSVDPPAVDRYTFGTPVVRTALDGSLYEAVAVTVMRNGAPYTTLHFGYRMGLVAAQTAASVSPPEREHYDLERLPAPPVEGRITEYVYRPLATGATPRLHAFYATTDAERETLDESEAWVRSGYEFKSGGYLPVCRFFYRPPNGGAATHVYTARADECAQLKTTAGFTYEGTSFRASLPRPQAVGQSADDRARCPEKTTPLLRLFNQPGDPAVAPNHRYVNSTAVAQLGNPPGWVNEGIAFCVPE